jgi:hypothetical protein
MIYRDFDDFGRYLAAKNKANQTQSLLALSTAVGLKKRIYPEQRRMEPICFVLSTE